MKGIDNPNEMYPCYKLIEMKGKMLEKVVWKEMKLQELAEHFSVTRQTASKWLAKYKHGGIAELVPKKPGSKTGTTWNRSSVEIEDRVVEIGNKHPFKGPDWLADELEKEGIKLNQSTVYRILKRRKARYYGDYKHKRRKKKSYCLDTPGREVQLDCCFPFGYQRKAIIYDAIDDCSRWVFGRVYTEHNAEATVAFLKQLIERAPFTISVIRTDQGSEFCNQKVLNFLTQHGITHKKNPPYTPQHNGKIERFHQTLKNDEVRINWYFLDTIETLNYKLSLFLNFYNLYRKHTGLHMFKMSPAQKIAYVSIHNSFSLNVNLILQQNRSVFIKILLYRYFF